MHFQDIISTLNRFWADQGCLLLQPYDTEKGAGTMSPHTVLRAIGPEPWAVAYPEPCRRPTDGRYGDNPNRAQHYFQAPRVGDSQLSSTKRMSWSAALMPNASNDAR